MTLLRPLGFILLVLVLTGFLSTIVTFAQDGTQFEPYGFWSGLWHGFSMTLAFLLSLVDPDVVIYSTNNIGPWYDFGYVLGVGLWFEFGAATHTRNYKEGKYSFNFNKNSDDSADKVSESDDSSKR